jgi:hypothetical protein
MTRSEWSRSRRSRRDGDRGGATVGEKEEGMRGIPGLGIGIIN